MFMPIMNAYGTPHLYMRGEEIILIMPCYAMLPNGF